jgi:WD40 repeat protein
MRSNIWSAPILANMASPPSSWRQLTSGDEEVECLTVSRDGRWLVYDSNRSGNQDIYKMPAGGGDPVQLTTDRADDFCGTMSPDGREILFYSFRLGANRREFTMLADGSRQQPVLNDSTGQHWAGDWSPNGNEIAFTSARTGARYTTIAARTDKGGWAVQREILELRPSNVSWSPDGRFLASVTDSGVTLFPAAGGTPRIVVPAEQMGNLGSCYAVWGPDPTILYYRTTNARGDASFWSIPIIGGAARLLLRLNLPAHASRHNAFGSDGTRLFFTMANDEASIWLLDLGYGAR